MERLLHKGMNFAFALALLAIAGGLLLSWKSSGKAGASEGKGTKPAAAAPGSQAVNSGVNQTLAINNTGGGSIQVGNVTATVNNYGLTKEQYEEGQNKLLDELAAKLQNADAGQRALLERQLQAVQEKLADTEKSYAEELEKRKSADEALAQMKGQLPDEQLKQAKLKLAQGETAAAEKAFDAVVDKEGGAVALAAYQSGQLAEGRLDYDKALRQYKKAVALEENKPEYLNAASEMARTMADLGAALNNLAALYYAQGRYSNAEPLYKQSLEISEKTLGKDHPNVAATLNKMAELYKNQGKYKEAELLYQRCLAIFREKFQNGHQNIDVVQKNYDELKRKMAEQK